MRPVPKKARQRTERRAAFAAHTPKAHKPVLGASTTRETPLTIRTLGPVLADAEREFIRTRVGFRLGKFGLAITRASVRFEDVSGPTGAPTVACRFKVVLRKGGAVTLSAESETPRDAFMVAAGAAERWVRKTLERPATTRRKAARTA